MIQKANKTKLWWWLPLIGIFFIQEVIAWIFNDKGEEIDNRSNFFFMICLVQIMYIITICYFLLKTN